MGFNIFHLRFKRQNRNQNYFINTLKCNDILINIEVSDVELGVRFQFGDFTNFYLTNSFLRILTYIFIAFVFKFTKTILDLK